MALSESAVSELLDVLRTGQAVDLIRESVRMVLQELIEAEATDVVGAARYERTDTRTNERNGSRPRTLSHSGRRHRLGHLQVRGVAHLRRLGRGRHRVPYPPAGPHRVPVRLPRRDLSARAQRHLPGRLHGRRGRHRHHHRRRPRGPRSGRGRQRGRSVLARLPVRFETTRPTCTTNGNQASATTCPRAPWPNATRPAILAASPRSTAASRHPVPDRATGQLTGHR